MDEKEKKRSVWLLVGLLHVTQTTPNFHSQLSRGQSSCHGDSQRNNDRQVAFSHAPRTHELPGRHPLWLPFCLIRGPGTCIPFSPRLHMWQTYGTAEADYGTLTCFMGLFLDPPTKKNDLRVALNDIDIKDAECRELEVKDRLVF